MTFGENLQFLRKRANMTQEDLAEKMEVSRQSVSKWESNSSYPETEAILRLCDLFHCDMDTLLRGDVSRRFGEDASLWDSHMNGFAAAIAAGVALVLGGITLMLAFVGLGANENRSLLVFLACLIAAVTTFVISGMGHAAFLRQHPGIGPCYTKEEMDRFERRFPFFIAAPITLILLGILIVVAVEVVPSLFRLKAMVAALLLLCITIAASTLTWAGIQHSKYGFPEEKMTPGERRVGRIWGAGMVAATAVFLPLLLIPNPFVRYAWVIYPVAALLCVALTILVKKDDE